MSTSYNPGLSRSLHERNHPQTPPRTNPERLAARSAPPPAFAQTALLFYEDPAEFQALRDAFLQEHNPQTPTERYFVNEMANAQWRLKRLRLIEADLIRLRLAANPEIDDHAAQAEALRLLAESNRALAHLLRQEAALRRQFERALKMLWECQSRRPENALPKARPKPAAVRRSPPSDALRAFLARADEFCAAPPPLPPSSPDAEPQPTPQPRL